MGTPTAAQSAKTPDELDEAPWQVLDLSEEAVAVPGSRWLAGIRVRLTLQSRSRATVVVRVALLADTVDDRAVASEHWETVIEPGELTVDVMLDGAKFRQLRRDGPYRLHVSVGGADGPQVVLWTRPYRCKDFRSAPPLRPAASSAAATSWMERSAPFRVVRQPKPVASPASARIEAR